MILSPILSKMTWVHSPIDGNTVARLYLNYLINSWSNRVSSVIKNALNKLVFHICQHSRDLWLCPETGSPPLIRVSQNAIGWFLMNKIVDLWLRNITYNCYKITFNLSYTKWLYALYQRINLLHRLMLQLELEKDKLFCGACRDAISQKGEIWISQTLGSNSKQTKLRTGNLQVPDDWK